MRRTWIIAILIVLFVPNITWVDLGISQEKQVVLKLGHAVAPEHPYHLGAVRYSDLVAQRTKKQSED